jgi:hypothetical protein
VEATLLLAPSALQGAVLVALEVWAVLEVQLSLEPEVLEAQAGMGEEVAVVLAVMRGLVVMAGAVQPEYLIRLHLQTARAARLQAVLAAVLLAVMVSLAAVLALVGRALAALALAQVAVCLSVAALQVAVLALDLLRPAYLAVARDRPTTLLVLLALVARFVLSGVPIGRSPRPTRGTYDSTISGRVHHQKPSSVQHRIRAGRLDA